MTRLDLEPVTIRVHRVALGRYIVTTDRKLTPMVFFTKRRAMRWAENLANGWSTKPVVYARRMR